MSSRRKKGWLAIGPQALPDMEQMVDNLAGPGVEAIAEHLGVSVSTIERWRAGRKWPRAAQLALYYETSFGRSFVSHEMLRDCQMLSQVVGHLQRENATLVALVNRLGGIADFGSANDPFKEIRSSPDFAARLGLRYPSPLPDAVEQSVDESAVRVAA